MYKSFCMYEHIYVCLSLYCILEYTHVHLFYLWPTTKKHLGDFSILLVLKNQWLCGTNNFTLLFSANLRLIVCFIPFCRALYRLRIDSSALWCLRIRVYTCVNEHTCIHINAYVYTCTCTQVQTHKTKTHTHIHTTYTPYTAAHL